MPPGMASAGTFAGKVIASYRRLWEIEEAFRISKHDISKYVPYSTAKAIVSGHIWIYVLSPMPLSVS